MIIEYLIKEDLLIRQIIGQMLLLCPFLWELSDDKKGDYNKVVDVAIRGLIALLMAIVNYYLVGVNIIASFLLSIAYHFFLFDYSIAATLGHDDWFKYLSKRGFIDPMKWWNVIGPYGRFGIRVVVLIVAILLYNYL